MADRFHEDFSRRHPVERSSHRSFGLLFAILFALFGTWPLLDGAPIRLWALTVSAVFGALAWLAPQLLAPLNLLWSRLGLFLHRGVSLFALGLLFFVTITPIAVVFRLLGKDVLNLRWNPKAASYWIRRQPPGPPPESMRNQF